MPSITLLAQAVSPVSDPANWLASQVGDVAIGFALGCICAWIFAQRTILKVAEQRITHLSEELVREREECNNRIERLEDRVQELEEGRFQLAMET